MEEEMIIEEEEICCGIAKVKETTTIDAYGIRVLKEEEEEEEKEEKEVFGNKKMDIMKNRARILFENELGPHIKISIEKLLEMIEYALNFLKDSGFRILKRRSSTTIGLSVIYYALYVSGTQIYLDQLISIFKNRNWLPSDKKKYLNGLTYFKYIRIFILRNFAAYSKPHDLLNQYSLYDDFDDIEIHEEKQNENGNSISIRNFEKHFDPETKNIKFINPKQKRALYMNKKYSVKSMITNISNRINLKPQTEIDALMIYHKIKPFVVDQDRRFVAIVCVKLVLEKINKENKLYEVYSISKIKEDDIFDLYKKSRMIINE